ncbi:MAG TPA: CaiB/BaiF CoA-transferase family protein [Acidimicrobiales bacterium]|nr:CaiB/BaiF CoA-transferase family protein [Acidimicrobiales bacterium]
MTTSLPPVRRPLAGTTVVDFSQFLAGPVAALRLGDLGARVIKVERPAGGDLARRLEFAGLSADGDSVSFHAMNRGKESLAADLKHPEDLALVRRVVERADVLVENFRPGVMARLGLDYESVRRLNPRLVYASVSGYGTSGAWAAKPGQDLLAQSLSGLPWLSGERGAPPVPLGLSIADHLASCHLALGVAALLVRRERTGEGGLVETSLLEGMLDLQFELLTARFTSPDFQPLRAGRHAANAYLAAPYGVYPTADGHLALAMNPVPRLGELLGIGELLRFEDPGSWWERRDEIIALLAAHLAGRPTDEVLELLEPADVWCAPVLTLEALARSEGFSAIEMMQRVTRQPAAGRGAPTEVITTRSPLRIDGALLSSGRGAPRLGADSEAVRDEVGSPGPAGGRSSDVGHGGEGRRGEGRRGDNGHGGNNGHSGGGGR